MIAVCYWLWYYYMLLLCVPKDNYCLLLLRFPSRETWIQSNSTLLFLLLTLEYYYLLCIIYSLNQPTLFHLPVYGLPLSFFKIAIISPSLLIQFLMYSSSLWMLDISIASSPSPEHSTIYLSSYIFSTSPKRHRVTLHLLQANPITRATEILNWFSLNRM